MLTDFHIANDHCIGANIRTIPDGAALASLYNSLINHWNTHIAIFVVTVSNIDIQGE